MTAKTKAQGATGQPSADVPTRSASAKGKLVHAVVSASKVLRYLRDASSPVTVTQISRECGLNLSTCFNILRTLIEEDYVQLDATGKTYTLGFGVVALAKGALDQSIELRALAPLIQEFAHQHNVMVTVWRRLHNDRKMLAALATSDAPVRIQGRLGVRSPLIAGASGIVFAACDRMGSEQLRDRFLQLRFARPLDFDTFQSQVAEAQQSGWAIDDGVVTPGTVSVAAPVWNADGSVTFCCSAVMFNGQYDPRRIATIAEELVTLGRSVLPTAPSPSDAGQSMPFAGRKARNPAQRAEATT